MEQTQNIVHSNSNIFGKGFDHRMLTIPNLSDFVTRLNEKKGEKATIRLSTAGVETAKEYKGKFHIQFAQGSNEQVKITVGGFKFFLDTQLFRDIYDPFANDPYIVFTKKGVRIRFRRDLYEISFD